MKYAQCNCDCFYQTDGRCRLKKCPPAMMIPGISTCRYFLPRNRGYYLPGFKSYIDLSFRFR